jgi:hypothetical protein
MCIRIPTCSINHQLLYYAYYFSKKKCILCQNENGAAGLQLKLLSLKLHPIMQDCNNVFKSQFCFLCLDLWELGL